jgi:peptidoglycan-N-acetylglucosamine deacetylase
VISPRDGAFLRRVVHPAARPGRVALAAAFGVVLAACGSAGGALVGRGPAVPPVESLPAPSPSLSSGVAPATTAAPSAVPTGRVGPDGLPQVITHGRRDRRLVALTFGANMTDSMLRKLDAGQAATYDDRKAIDELIRLNVPATFFLAGKWVLRYPEETRRLAANPLFELGSHSWSDRAFATPCYGLDPIPAGEMAADVRESYSVLRRFIAHPVPYFRFPGGCYDDTARRAVAPTGVTLVQYDVASGDAFATSADVVVADTLSATRDGSIVALHITQANAPVTALALPRIVAGLRARGYRLVKVSELLAQGGY